MEPSFLKELQFSGECYTAKIRHNPATTHLARQSGAEASDWWIHPELGIPVRGQIVGGMEYVLSSLEIAPRG